MFQIQILNGQGQLVDQIPLTDKTITFGRDPKNTVSLSEVNVSRRHASIEPHGNFFILKDLASMNWTWVNRKPVKSHILRSGDIVQIGQHRICVGETRRSNENFREQNQTRIVDTCYFDKSLDSEHTLRLTLNEGVTGFVSSPLGSDRVTRIQEISRDISRIETPAILYQKIVEIVLSEFKADRASFLIAGESGATEPVAVLSSLDEDPEEVFAIHRGVLQTAVHERTAILTEDANLGQRFQKRESETADRVYSVMCVPLISKDQILGAIYLDRVHNVAPFKQEDLVFLTVIAGHTAISLMNANLFQSILTEKRKIQTIIDNLHDGLVITDTTFTIEEFNVAALRMLSRKRTNLNGRNLLTLLKDLDPNLEETKFLEATAEHSSFQLVVQSHDSFQAYLVSVAPLPQGEDGSTRITYAFRDSTGFINLETLKSEFIRRASHKLRTPLTVVMGNMELLKNEISAVQSNGLDSLIQGIDQNLDQLQSLVNRFVEFTELDSHSEPFRELSISELLDLAWAGLLSRAEEKGVRLAKSVKVSHPVQILGSTDRLLQCFTNIFDNAIKFSPQEGTVRICIEEDSESYVVSIGDEGTGIPKEALPLVFTGFHQVENPPTGETEGAGLGLTIAKRVLQAHDASIHASSPDPETGRGTLVTIRFDKERHIAPHAIYLETDRIPNYY